LGEFNSAWFIATAIGVVLVAIDFLISEQWRKRIGWALLSVGLLLFFIGLDGGYGFYTKFRKPGTSPALQSQTSTPEKSPPKSQPPAVSSTGSAPPTKDDFGSVTEAIWFGIHGTSRKLLEQFRTIDPSSLSLPSGANSINTVDNLAPQAYDKAWTSTFGKVLLCDPENGVVGSALTFTVSRHPSIAVQILNVSFNGTPCRVVAHISAPAVTNAIHGYVFTGNAGQHFGYILDLPIQRDTFGLRFYMTGEEVKDVAQGYSPQWRSFAIDDPKESIQLELTRKKSQRWLPIPDFQELLPSRFTLTTDLMVGGPKIVREFELVSNTPRQVARGDDASGTFVWAFTWHRVRYGVEKSTFGGSN